MGTDEFTIEFWFYPTSIANDQYILTSATGTQAWSTMGFTFFTTKNGKIECRSSSGGSARGVTGASTNTFTVNAWNHVAAVKDVAAGRYYLYLNGVRNGGLTISFSGNQLEVFTIDPYVTAGGFGSGWNFGSRFNGYIDDIRITKGVCRYTTATLTPPTQPFLNALKVPIITDGLVYNLDVDTYPGSGTTLTDLSGNGNTGILQNAPTYVDVYGGSLYFDGTNEWVSGTVYDIATDYSFSIWLKLDTLSITHYLISGSVAFTGNYNIILTTSGIVAVASRGNPVVPFSEFTASIDTIYQLVVTKSGTSYNLYVNGSNVSSKTYNNAGLIYSPNRLFANEFSNGLFKGSLYRTSAYSRELTAAEVQQNFNALKGRFGL
jgi:hypothetical protein